MNTYRELIYLVLDELKLQSDDVYFTEEHVMYLLNKYRPLILKQRYADVRKEIPDSNFQSIVLGLQNIAPAEGELDGNQHYMRTTVKVPDPINLNGGQRIITVSSYKDYWTGELAYVNSDRFKYTGFNRWISKSVYATIGPDGYMYLKSGDTGVYNITKVMITTIFENPVEVNELDIDSNGKIKDPFEIECPLEANLIPILVQMVVKELMVSVFRTSDIDNDSTDGTVDNYNKNARAQQYMQAPQYYRQPQQLQ